jgi:hypothetical protein
VIQPSRASRERTRSSAGQKNAVVVREVTRHIRWPKRLLLVAQSGGRCEFDGCNEYLFEHPVTLTEGNFSQFAHIVAFSPDGPRGRSGRRPNAIHSLDNLMLLCPRCHKLVDDNEGDFPRDALVRQKIDHEERIRFLTDLRPDRKTAVIQFKAKVRGRMVDIPNADIASAVAPRYPTKKVGYVLDLTSIDDSGPAFVETAKATIARQVELFYGKGTDVETVRHVSLFALGPIPLLVFLGSCLGDKIYVDLFQRHRDTGTWNWKEPTQPTSYVTRVVRPGADPSRVALVIALSGTIPLDRLPATVDDAYSIYELTLGDRSPGVDFLRCREDLERFRAEYRRLLAMLVRKHPSANEVLVFPAVPAPVAVAIGLDRLPSVQPHLVIHNDEGVPKGFEKILVVAD